MNSKTVSLEGRVLAQPSHVDVQSDPRREHELYRVEMHQDPTLAIVFDTQGFDDERSGEAREPLARVLDSDSLSSNLAGDRSNLDEFVIVKYWIRFAEEIVSNSAGIILDIAVQSLRISFDFVIAVKESITGHPKLGLVNRENVRLGILIYRAKIDTPFFA